MLFLKEEEKKRSSEFGTRGAGGSDGGVMRFFIGLVMFIAGLYLFLSNIQVGMGGFGGMMGGGLYNVGGFNITTGYVLIPFMFGIGMIFYNSDNYLGWILSIASVVMIVFGVITNVNMRFHHLSAFDLIMILVLMIGGIGLFLSSLKTMRAY